MKSALIHAIYKKAIYLDNDAKRKSTVGEIVNLMAIDSDRVNLAVGYLWVLWSAPYQATLAFILLYGQVGNAVFGGLTIIILSIPLNFILASLQRKLQIGQLKFKDRRIRQMAEILNGMKVIKLYAWEPPFIKRISDSRRQEMGFLIKAAYLNGVNTFTWTFLPFLVMITTFLIYVYGMDQPLTANKAFVTVALFNILRAPLNILPMLIAFLVQALVSLKRIGRFLNHGDVDMSSIGREPDEEFAIRMDGVNLAWSKMSKPFLKDIDFRVKHGELTAIVGQVGAGKSSMITSLLGDMSKVDGTINVSGEIAYIAQQAWIQNLTLKDNILFGKDYIKNKYETVIEACALVTDLEILPGGDQTEIGEKGINLSGGQKQRVNIARAVYQNSEIYLFDDPLSAVDSHVGKHLFDHVVGPKGILKSKTRVLVTHGLAFLKHVDNVVFMKEGAIEAQGKFNDLMEQSDSFKEFVAAANLAAEDKDEAELSMSSVEKSLSLSFSKSLQEGRARTQSAMDRTMYKAERKRAGRKRLFKTISFIENDTNNSVDLTNLQRETNEKTERAQTEAGALISTETAAEGRISMAVVKAYAGAIGYGQLALAMTLFAFYQFFAIGAQLWLTAWADWTQKQLNKPAPVPKRGNNIFSSVYAGFGVGMAVFILLYGLSFSVALVRASAKLHRAILNNIMRCPMLFFDSVPSGRIVNRFSKDVEVTDNTLPQTVRSFLATFFTVLQIFILISFSTPIFLVVLVPLVIFYWFVQRFYVKTSRQLKRVESTTRSPIFNHFSETLTGTTVIRAYGAEERFIEDNHARVDENNIYYYAGTIVAARWLGIRLEFLGSLVVLAASMLAVIGRNSLSSGVVGLAVSSSLQITGALNWSVRMMSDLETYIVSVERLKEYEEVENEADWNIEETKPPADWPEKGIVKFTDYSTRYRADLDLVLNKISFEATAGEKLGIVGRTGAGKSSLTLALFRIIEATDGYIEIDGHRLSALGLHQLRKRLTILPQDPVLFSGSIRENLDPFSVYEENAIWDSLGSAHLKNFTQAAEGGLEYDVGEGGSNLSVGQRQLVCLARALLHKTSILILDEATAAVDLQTDELIQKTIREEFKECTVVTIAHRLNTILDYDRVMVLGAGQILEFDSPRALLDNQSSAFYSMALDAGIINLDEGTSTIEEGSTAGDKPPADEDQPPAEEDQPPADEDQS
jgi:ABC-type multidrug transport system fused ATPase/permease subunit